MSVKLALILGLLLVDVVAYAAIEPTDKLTFSAGLAYEHSDNIYYSPVNKKSENILHTLFETNYQKRTARLDADFTLNADHLNYQKHTFTNRTIVSSNLSLAATLEKERFFWDMNNRLARVQINQAIANIPTNQENTNYFMTGPRLVFFKNNKESLNAGIRYEKFYTETSSSDYTGYIFDAAYHRNITHTAAMELYIKYNNKKFDDKLLNADYKRTDVTLDLSKRTKLSTFGITVGRTLLNYQHRPSYQDDIFRFRYQYLLGTLSSFNATYSRELSDFSSVFASAAPGGATYTNVTGSIFLRKLGQLSIVRNFASSSLAYTYTYSSNDYSDNLLNIITRESMVSLNKKINSSLNLKLSARYRDTSYVAGNRVDLAKLYSLDLVRTFLTSYDLALSMHYLNNESTDSNFGYDERRIILSGHYYFR